MAKGRREVWFRWVLWFHWPVHWKGWAEMLLTLALILPLVLLLSWSAQASVPAWINYALAGCLAAVLVGHLTMIVRHTGPRR